jgi:hypothetical protein
MEYILSEIIKNPTECPILQERGYLVYRIHKIDSEWNRDNYIGDTNELLEERLFNHQWGHLNFDAPWATKKLRNAILKYGTNRFTLEIIYKGDYIDWLEEYYITMHDSYEHGYNQNRSGKGTGGMTSEQARKIAENLGPEGCRERSLAAARTIGPEGYKELARKAIETQRANGTLLEKSVLRIKTMKENGSYEKWQNSSHSKESAIKKTASKRANGFYDFDRASARIQKAMETMKDPITGQLPFNSPEAQAKSKAKRAVKWVWYNKELDKYIIHVLNWSSHANHGFYRIVPLSDWESYCANHNIDKNLLPDQ